MRKFILILVCLYGAEITLAQHAPAFFRISDVIGLSGKYISCTVQDRKGFIWIAASNGLFRYDGNKLLDASHDLKSNYSFQGISEMICDGEGYLWLLSDEHTGRFNTGNFHYEEIPTYPSQEILKNRKGESLHLYKNHEGKIFMVEAQFGISVFDAKKRRFVPFNLFQLPAGWHPRRISEDPVRHDWLIASDSGLAIYDKQSGMLMNRYHNPDHNPILDLHERLFSDFIIDKERRYWITYWSFTSKKFGHNLLCYNSKERRFTADTAGIRVRRAYSELGSFFEDSKGALWIDGLNSFFHYVPDAHRFYYIPSEPLQVNSIHYEKIWNIMEDREGSIWVSSDKGLYVHYPSALSSVNLHREDLSVNCIYEKNANEIWTGNWEGGIMVFDSNLNVLPYHFNYGNKKTSGFYKMVWSFQQQLNTPLLWAGCQKGHIQIIDTTTRKTVLQLEPGPLGHSTIRQIVNDSRGNMWMGTQNGLVVQWKRGNSYADSSFKVFQQFHCIILCLFADREDHIWIGTEDQGLYVLDPVQNRFLHHYTSFAERGHALSNQSIKAIRQLNDSVFLALGFALNTINIRNGTIKQTGTEEGLPDNNGSSLQVDHKGTIWITSYAALTSYQPQKEMISRYGVMDNLGLNNFVYASHLSEGGRLYAGGEKMLSAISLPAAQHLAPPPAVTITQLLVSGRLLNTDSVQKLVTFRLPYEQNSISLSFSVLNYLLKDKLSFYYKLEEAGKDWMKADISQTIQYSLLLPGRYTILIQCVNQDGLSGPVTRIRFYISVPFWLSWWFILIFFFLFISGAYAIYVQHTKRALAIEKVRQRVARDLHDDMGSTLSTINILSLMARNKLMEDPVKTSEFIIKISENCTRMMEAMDDIVWSINPMNDSMEKVIARMRSFSTEIFEARHIDLSFYHDAAVTSLKLTMEQRRDLFLIFKEAVNNIAKYAHCMEATINMQVEKKMLRLVIQDNGRGFDVARADSGNGLNNMQKRALHLGGTLSIHSRKEKGTTITLEIPVAQVPSFQV